MWFPLLVVGLLIIQILVLTLSCVVVTKWKVIQDLISYKYAWILMMFCTLVYHAIHYLFIYSNILACYFQLPQSLF